MKMQWWRIYYWYPLPSTSTRKLRWHVGYWKAISLTCLCIINFSLVIQSIHLLSPNPSTITIIPLRLQIYISYIYIYCCSKKEFEFHLTFCFTLLYYINVWTITCFVVILVGRKRACGDLIYEKHWVLE